MLRASRGTLAAMMRCLSVALVLVLAACSTETRLTEVVPSAGTYTGGEEVEIRGANFPRSSVTVRFGVKEATNVVMQSASSIKVMSPVGDKGTAVDITVVFDDGRAFVVHNGFHFVEQQQRQVMDKFFNRASGQQPTK